MTIHPKCDFCANNNLETVYQVPESELNMQITVCDRCGLVQSILQREKTDNDRIVTTSSGANWGNIRHGKKLRFKAICPLLEKFIPWSQINRVLDVGSNRGSFVQWLAKTKSIPEVVGVEPDKHIVDEYRALPNLTLYLDRFEELNLPKNHFDLVYCAHTLEHADSAAGMLRQIWRLLKEDGYLLLEVPNIEVLSTPDMLEEFFIDKHRFHFNRKLLTAFIQHLGFTVEYGMDSDDVFNITLLLRKQAHLALPKFLPPNPKTPTANKDLIQNYIVTLNTNREHLQNIVETKIHPFMARQKVAFWGASKLFDALVRFGGLQTDQVYCLVDEYLWNILPMVHGVNVNRSEYLKIAQPQVVIVLARSSADEIVEKVRRFGVRNIIRITDLMI